jgi:hypothetical protein
MIDLRSRQQAIIDAADDPGRWWCEPEARRQMDALWGCVPGQHTNDHNVFIDVKDAFRVTVPSGKAHAAVGYAISPHGWYATGCDVHLAAAGHVEPVSTKQAFAYESLAEAIEETWFYNLRVWLSERMGEVEHKTRCDQAQRLFSLSRDAVERLCHGPDQPGLFEPPDNKARLVRNHWNPEVVHLSKPDGRPVPGGASFYHDWGAAIADARKLGWDVESEAPA